MHPCKECITKACCSKDCSEYKSFIKFMSEMTILLSGLICFLGILPLGIYVLNVYGGWPISIFWISCYSISQFIQEIFINKIKTMEAEDKITGIVSFIFTPFVLTFLILMLLFKPYVTEKTRA